MLVAAPPGPRVGSPVRAPQLNRRPAGRSGRLDRIRAVNIRQPPTPDIRLPDLHPQNDDGTWRQHCTGCGMYLDDTEIEPPTDSLCDDCTDPAGTDTN